MTVRARAGLYGMAVLLVLAGVLGAVFVPGRTGEALAIAGGALGGIGLISMVFLEVGLSEDRERSRVAQASAKPPPTNPPRRVARRARRRG